MTDLAQPSTLDRTRLAEAARRLGLSDDERALLEALIELEQDDASRAEPPLRPSLAQVAGALGRAIDLRVLLPSATLRRLRIVEPQASRFDARPLRHQPLALSERFLAHVLDAGALHALLEPYVSLAEPTIVLSPAQAEQAHALAQAWRALPAFDAIRPIALCGRDGQAQRAVAWQAARLCGLRMVELRAAWLPEAPAERADVVRALQLEMLLEGLALFVDASALTDAQSVGVYALEPKLGGPRVFALSEGSAAPAHALKISVARAEPTDRAQLITALLGERAAAHPGFAEELASQFDLGLVAVYEAGTELLARAAHEPELDVPRALRLALRDRARPALGVLAQAMESRVDWSDLILPDAQLALLHEAVAQVRHRDIVHRRWGFGAKSTRGLSLTALFSGPSGTGKTLAAEVVANDLGLELLRVDLSSVVSKYIGETEKHIAQIFDAAEAGGAVLLFDEADALFGPRSKVKDSHDRNANIEVSFLLQRLEAFSGLAVLTTNFKENIDTAFLRRIRFHVEFPFPDRATRAQLWRSAFPPAVPLGPLDFDRLSRLSLTGGHIRNIALNGAFRAARENSRIELRHLADSARGEFKKSEKPVPEVELRALLEARPDDGSRDRDPSELS